MPTIYGKITQDDIDRGIKCMCTTCPLALSINRHLNPLRFIAVGLRRVSIYVGVRSVYIPLPRKMTSWVARFDSGKPVRPITWSITGDQVDKYFKGGV